MKEELFNLAEGAAILRYPEKLSPESVQDLADRLELVIRLLKRTAVATKADEK